MATADVILQGAFDLHAHGSPEFTTAMPGRVDNVEWGRLAAAAGMRGFVIKSHIFPTIGAATALQSIYPDLTVVPSITLNPTAGGLDPLSVEIAVESGARVVWMPTWSARQESPTHSVFLERMSGYISSLDTEFWPRDGLTILDGDGGLLPEVDRIARICAERGAVVASGHLPIAASRVLCRRTRELGGQFVLTHPLSPSVGATIEDQIEIAGLGGTIEHVFVACMPMHNRMDPRKIREAIEAVGAEHCVMSSDAIEAWNPPEPELLRMFIASMLSLGVSEDEVHLMTHDNPARVLGLPSTREDTTAGSEEA
jgi:hypothetical protein